MSALVGDPELFTWLEQWYHAQCDGTWEHGGGIKIETLDNPGWKVVIELPGIEPEPAFDRVLAVLGEPPSAKNGYEGGSIWMECELRSGKFVGAGDPTQLRALIAQFRAFIEAGVL